MVHQSLNSKIGWFMTTLAILLSTWLFVKHDLIQENYVHSKKFQDSQVKSENIKKYLAVPHSDKPLLNSKELNKKHAQEKQDEIVYKILNKTSGFFLEMGALDGKFLSNTLWLENRHDWTGLLIEANPELCSKIDTHKRNAWTLCACISNVTEEMDFIIGGTLGGVKNHIDTQHMRRLNAARPNALTVRVPCVKMMDVLHVIGVNHIDYFSLDVEGGELFVLESMHKELMSGELTVNVWTIEYAISNEYRLARLKTAEKLENIRNFFKRIGGYNEHSTIKGLDVVFVRENLM